MAFCDELTNSRFDYEAAFTQSRQPSRLRFRTFILHLDFCTHYCYSQNGEFHHHAGKRKLCYRNFAGSRYTGCLSDTVFHRETDRKSLRRNHSRWTESGPEKHCSGYLDGSNIPAPVVVGGSGSVRHLAEYFQFTSDLAKKKIIVVELFSNFTG